jgi:hypothetical protein
MRNTSLWLYWTFKEANWAWHTGMVSMRLSSQYWYIGCPVLSGNPTTRPPTTRLQTGRPKPTRPNDRWTKRQLDQIPTRPNNNSTKIQSRGRTSILHRDSIRKNSSLCIWAINISLQVIAVVQKEGLLFIRFERS